VSGRFVGSVRRPRARTTFAPRDADPVVVSSAGELASLVVWSGAVVGSSGSVVGSSVVVDGSVVGSSVVVDGGLVVVDGGLVVVDGGFVVVDGLLVVVLVVDGFVVLVVVVVLVGFLVVLLGSLLSEVTAGRVVVVTTVLPFASVVVVVTTTGGASFAAVDAPFDGEPVGPVVGTAASCSPSLDEEATVEAGNWVPSASLAEALRVLSDGKPFSGPPVRAHAGAATTTAAATPPMMGRRSNRGRGARCLPTYLMARSRLPEPGSVRCLTAPTKPADTLGVSTAGPVRFAT
jgi:hypothetical protein